MFALFLTTFAFAAEPDPAALEEGEFQLDMVSADMLRQLCEGSPPDASACHRLGRRYEQGIGGVKVSYPDSGAWYRKGCDGGVVMDCGLGANSYAQTNDPAAYPLATKGCDAKEPVACYVLGHLQILGIGTAVDGKQGLARISAGCDAGIVNACVELGQVYAGGVPSVPADYAKARPLLEKACAEKDQASCGWLGNLLLTGKGGAVDTKRGFSVLESSCASGYGVACESVAAAYVQGIGVPIELPKAVPWLVKACDAQMALSCAQLATMSLSGQGGLTADRPKAIGYLKRSCDYGHAAACQEADAACRSGAKDACR